MRTPHHVSALLLLFFVMLAGVPAHAAYSPDTVPNPRMANDAGHVSDPEGVLNADALHMLESRLAGLEAAGKAQVAVVILPAIQGDEPRRFANELFAHWGIGHKDRDDGLLILLITGKPRSITFETGYGLEGSLTDVICDRIQEQMLPFLRSEQWGEALSLAATAVNGYLGPGREPASSRSPYNGPQVTIKASPVDGENWLKLYLFVCFLIIVLVILSKMPAPCPSCEKREFRRKNRKILNKASFESEGREKTVHECAACGHRTEEEKVIPKLTILSVIFSGDRDSSDYDRSGGSGGSWGGDGRSSGGGGGWGGGRSGGGGSSKGF